LRAVGVAQVPDALVFFAHRGQAVLHLGARDFAEPTRRAAPLALLGAVAQAQAVVDGVARAAVLALGEQAGGGLEAAVAQQQPLRRARGGRGQAVRPPLAPRPARPRESAGLAVRALNPVMWLSAH
jgi:hypothetical protein